VRGLSYIVISGLSAVLGSSVLASCGSQFTAGGVTSEPDASASGGNAGTGGGSAGSGVGGDTAGGSGDSATGGSAGTSTGGSGGSGTGGSHGIDAGPPLQCMTDNDCDDKNVCTGIEVCRQGKCAPGAGMACAGTTNPCTTTSCDPLKGCVTINNTAACSDGNMCTTGDTCSAGACKAGAPKICPANQTCDPTTGLCKCAANAILCNNTCVLTACCPGALSGPCGRCGTWKCNDLGTGLVCTNQHGNCDPGWTCSGMCMCPAGGDCSCPVGQRRDCSADCNVTGCF